MKKGLIVLFVALLILSACTISDKEIIKSSDFKINENGDLIFKGANLGQVKGIDGKDGINGVDGKDGKNGIDGKNGQDGYNGNNALQPEYFRYIDLSKYNVGDSVPINSGRIPFTWVIDDSRWIKIDEVSLKLVSKFNIEDSKSDINKRVYDSYYPYLLELKIRGSTSIEMAESHNVVVIFNDESVGRGGGSEIKPNGTFEIIEQFGEHNYNELIFSRAYFEGKIYLP